MHTSANKIETGSKKTLHIAYSEAYSQRLSVLSDAGENGEYVAAWNSNDQLEWTVPVSPLLLTGKDRRRRVFNAEELQKLRNDEFIDSKLTV